MLCKQKRSAFQNKLLNLTFHLLPNIYTTFKISNICNATLKKKNYFKKFFKPNNLLSQACRLYLHTYKYFGLYMVI